MKKITALVMLILSLALVGTMGTALAQEEVREGDRVEYKKRTVIDFSDVTIQGELTRPEGSYVVSRKKTKFSQLIQIRKDFLPELLASTDYL